MCKNPAMSGSVRPHRVAVLAVDGVIGFELGIPERILGTTTTADGVPLYDVRVASPDGGPVRTSAGYRVLPEYGADALERAETLVVPAIAPPRMPGSRLPPGAPGAADPDPRVIDLVRRAGARGRVVAICTGAFTLAAAGLLDGRRATTHWALAARFRRTFPRVELDPDVLFVDDGEVLTSAGVAAGIDLCLHLVRRDHGAGIAAATARRNVVAPWREGGQAQFIESGPPADGPDTAAVREWALGHLDESLPVEELAARASMSPRTFSRRFRAETGTSPARWLASRRLDLVRRLLETTDLPVEQVAARAGFGTTAALRQRLHAEIGMAPLAYRRAHRAPSGAA